MSNLPLNVFDLLVNSSNRYLPLQDNTKMGYPVDVYHNDEVLVFEIPVVGGNREDLSINVEGELLKISYKKSTVDRDSYTYIYKGIAKRNFDLSWKVSSKFDLKNLTANFSKGLLTITVPIAEESKPKQIEIVDLDSKLLEQ